MTTSSGCDHAQVAVHRFRRMDEVGRRAGARQRRAIFRQTMPDLPMPVRMTRPRQSRTRATAAENRRRAGRPARARPPPRSRARRGPGRGQPSDRAILSIATSRASSGSTRSSAQGVGGVAHGGGRVLVDFHEHAVHAGRDPGPGQRRDVLGQAGGHPVAGARQLEAVGDVEDDRMPSSRIIGSPRMSTTRLW